MLQQLTEEQVKQIATLAKAVRKVRDALLNNVPDEDLGEPPSARREHNPTAAFALDPLPADDPSLRALRQAVSALPPAARSELFVLMRMGQGDLAINNWGRGLSEAERLGEETVTAAVMEDVDLHDHLTKGLYEVTPSSELRSSSHGRQTQAEFYSRRVPQLTYLIVVKGFDHRRGEIERDGWEQ